jgi:hypothetical protein
MSEHELVPNWPRPYFTGSNERVDHALVCFADQEHDVDLARDGAHGYPQRDRFEFVSCRPARRAEFEASGFSHFDGALGAQAKELIGGAAVATLSWQYFVQADLEDPDDLSHLQTMWAMVRQIAMAGAGLVYEEATAAWFLTEELLSLPPRRPLTLGREIRIIREIDSEPDFGHVMHTRGMRKFTRPDLMIGRGVMDFEVDQAAAILDALSNGMALGAQLAPGFVVVDGYGRVPIEPYEPGVNVPAGRLLDAALVVNLPRDRVH